MSFRVSCFVFGKLRNADRISNEALYSICIDMKRRLMISGNFRMEIGMDIGSKSKQAIYPLQSVLSLQP